MSHSSGPNLGEVHIGGADEAAHVKLSDYGLEDWLAFVLFWALATVVFLQFYTRYVLNDSLAWTEEIARYLLIMVTFVGAGMAVRRMSHIHVEFIYVYLTRPTAQALSTAVDLIRVAFFGYAAWLCFKVTQIMHGQRMVVIEWPMSLVYGACTFGLALATWRAAVVAWNNWRYRSSILIRVREEGRHQ
ncbi:MAG: TRAP transporter small permease [Alphaproteobacteria bacterium]|nr:TRAP transporter small permease [Alphaproteobacteria bacterium]